MTDFTYNTATELMVRLNAGEVTSTQLLEQHIARVAQHDGPINAVVVRSFDAARDRAAQADAARARGEVWGALHGLPMTVKESFDLPGTPTSWGFPQYKDNISQQPAVAVQRLLDAGAVVFGKTNVPVALGDWQSFNPVYGRPITPGT
jgi:amidase